MKKLSWSSSKGPDGLYLESLINVFELTVGSPNGDIRLIIYYDPIEDAFYKTKDGNWFVSEGGVR